MGVLHFVLMAAQKVVRGGVIRVARVIVIGPVVDRVGVCVGIVAASLVAILAKGNVVVCAQR